MAERKSFLIRIDGALLDGVRRWADDDLRSLNAQIEYILRNSLKQAGRLPKAGPPEGPESDPEPAS